MRLSLSCPPSASDLARTILWTRLDLSGVVWLSLLLLRAYPGAPACASHSPPRRRFNMASPVSASATLSIVTPISDKRAAAALKAHFKVARVVCVGDIFVVPVLLSPQQVPYYDINRQRAYGNKDEYDAWSDTSDDSGDEGGGGDGSEESLLFRLESVELGVKPQATAGAADAADAAGAAEKPETVGAAGSTASGSAAAASVELAPRGTCFTIRRDGTTLLQAASVNAGPPPYLKAFNAMNYHLMGSAAAGEAGSKLRTQLRLAFAPRAAALGVMPRVMLHGPANRGKRDVVSDICDELGVHLCVRNTFVLMTVRSSSRIALLAQPTLAITGSPTHPPRVRRHPTAAG